MREVRQSWPKYAGMPKVFQFGPLAREAHALNEYIYSLRREAYFKDERLNRLNGMTCNRLWRRHTYGL